MGKTTRRSFLKLGLVAGAGAATLALRTGIVQGATRQSELDSIPGSIEIPGIVRILDSNKYIITFTPPKGPLVGWDAFKTGPEDLVSYSDGLLIHMTLLSEREGTYWTDKRNLNNGRPIGEITDHKSIEQKAKFWENYQGLYVDKRGGGLVLTAEIDHFVFPNQIFGGGEDTEDIFVARLTPERTIEVATGYRIGDGIFNFPEGSFLREMEFYKDRNLSLLDRREIFLEDGLDLEAGVRQGQD